MALSRLPVVALLIVVSAGLAMSQAKTPTAAKSALGKLPLYFVENRGVYSDEVRYYIQGADKTLYFTDQGVTIALKGNERGWTVKLDFEGANPKVKPEGRDKQEAVFSYFTGSKKNWKAGLPTFAKVVYRNLWLGIDLVYRAGVNKLKYEFVVAPGADPSLIRLRYRGATSVTATEAGALTVRTPEGSFEDAPPVAWQEIDGKREPVEMAYALGQDGKFCFTVGDYDVTKPLILDPVVAVYCGYIGGNGTEWPSDVAIDPAGNLYSAGMTTSTGTFPYKAGPNMFSAGGMDGYVAKVGPRGHLVYCGFIGGKSDEVIRSIAVDSSGNAYVAGDTGGGLGSSLPVKIGPDLTFNGGYKDAFVAKVNAAGTALVYCGFLGGSGDDEVWDIAVDAVGIAYVTGTTTSTESTFPVRVGPDLTHNGGGFDVFVARINATGNGLDYCGYIGGALFDYGHGIAVDGRGCAYVVGTTSSDQRSFPVLVGPCLKHGGGPHSHNYDAFVAKVSSSGVKLDYCGYIGGFGQDGATDATVDGSGSLYLTGYTGCSSQTFPVKVGPDLTYNGGPGSSSADAFVAKVNPAGTSIVFCGYIGGVAVDGGTSIALMPSGDLSVVGATYSDEKTFPVLEGPDLTANGQPDAFIAVVSATGRGLIQCGFLGGDSYDTAESVAVDGQGNIYVSGYAYSTEKTFPVKVGPDLTHNGGPSAHNQADAYVACFAITRLSATGMARPGGAISLDLTATDSAGRPYQLGSSLGSGPMLIGGRRIGLSPDSTLAASVSGLVPSVFAGYRGTVGAQGLATAALKIPSIPALTGTRVYSAFVTLDLNEPSGIRSISNTFMFTVGK